MAHFFHHVLATQEFQVSIDLTIPTWVILVSLTSILVHIIYRIVRPSKKAQLTSGSRVKDLGGPVIVAFRCVRAAASIGLFIVTILGLQKQWDYLTYWRSSIPFLVALPAAYSSILSIVTLASSVKWCCILTRHVNAVMFITFAVYLYRDILPLATFTLPMRDEPSVYLWTEIVLLFIVGVFIPLVIPREYVPFNSEEPFAKAAPEQTASILSLATYTFMDSVVFRAAKTEHLKVDELPSLADFNAAANLKTRSFKYLDTFTGAKKRHIFFGIFSLFRVEFIVGALLSIIMVAADFASPLAIYQLLEYLSSDGKDTVIRPWIWVGLLFFGPLVFSFSFQWYIYISTGQMVQYEAIITELVFEHALRIRVKSESESTKSTPAGSIHEGADAAQEDGASDPKVADKPKDANLIGKINNLISADVQKVIMCKDFIMFLFQTPVRLTVCIWFLYSLLGWSAFVGMAAMILALPLPGWISKLAQTVKAEAAKRADARVESVTEAMGLIRMIKLFAWEDKMTKRVTEKRDEELVWVKKDKMLSIWNYLATGIVPLVVMTTVMKGELTASKVFSTITVFEMLRSNFQIIAWTMMNLVSGKVSLDRLTKFLQDTELLDKYTSTSSDAIVMSAPTDVIGFSSASFAWSSDSLHDGSLTPSKRNFLLKIPDELHFQKGVLNLIIGSTGSGKTSMLMALLGEMHFIPNTPAGWYNLPRDGGVAYAAQESWVQNETIRENILFGSVFDEERYNKVLHQCGLEQDIVLFEAGDKTEVGERGLTLSGGQKTRITLARAVYSKAQIVLLDDILAALDVHTSKWIVDKCLSGDLLEGRTVIMVTHNVAMLQPVAKFVIALKDGNITSQGTVSDVVAHDDSVALQLKREVEQLKNVVETEKEDNDGEEVETADPAKPSKGKLILSEEISIGHVSVSAYVMFLKGLGGNHPFLFFGVWLGCFLLSESVVAIQTWMLGQWAHQYEIYDPSQIPVLKWIGLIAALATSVHVIEFLGYLYYMYGQIRMSRMVHQMLMKSVFGTTLRWLDTTPTSRIITRCTQDIAAIDQSVPQEFRDVVNSAIYLTIKFAAVLIITPIFFGPGVLVFVLGALVGQMYIKAQLAVKREQSVSKAPVLGHFGAAIVGLTSIRAYGVEEQFKQRSLELINVYSRVSRPFYNLNRWVSIRIDVIGAAFASSLAAYLVYYQRTDASSTGFSLNMAVSFSSMILWWIRMLNNFEVAANSLERIEQYINIEQEPAPTQEGKPPAYWPASGSLNVENLSAKYSPDGAEVLHSVSFSVKSGERVGVVGRTGSGKSSLTLALLRCIYTDGDVLYDGISTNSMNLDALRSNITIIPQMPELLSGTLRHNLDPFDQYDDAILNDALRAAGLFSLQDETEESRLTLDSNIAGGGSNLSVGQRQIMALARAIVRQSKLLILDEATSAIDYKTDTIIQTSLRTHLSTDTTLITVAHRLQTIMDADKIMVLDEGNIVEFDSPVKLLKIEGGRFRGLVDESGDRDALYKIVKMSS